MMKISLLTILLITGVFAQELEVEGSLKVSGEIDASNQKITNVADPTLSTDAATAYYVDERTAGKGRIIALKCAWHIFNGNGQENTEIGSCEPSMCPDGWSDLATSNEVTAGYGNV
ncbi:uncharacterized protein METZ01_LOCUS268868, partial [marine metagenome]